MNGPVVPWDEDGKKQKFTRSFTEEEVAALRAQRMQFFSAKLRENLAQDRRRARRFARLP